MISGVAAVACGAYGSGRSRTEYSRGARTGSDRVGIAMESQVDMERLPRGTWLFGDRKPPRIKCEAIGEAAAAAHALPRRDAGTAAVVDVLSAAFQRNQPDRLASGVCPPTKRRRMASKRGSQISLVGNTNGTDLESLDWGDALQLLKGQGVWDTSEMVTRPDYLRIIPARQVFVEHPRRRRRAGSDRWLNSGGLKGATTHWFDAQDGIRLRYGKILCARSDRRVKFVELTLLQNMQTPVEVKVSSQHARQTEALRNCLHATIFAH
eukprot:COSAG02_NODE_163_length_32424_cov_21.759010_16_plen_266_part_00